MTAKSKKYIVNFMTLAFLIEFVFQVGNPNPPSKITENNGETDHTAGFFYELSMPIG